MVDSPFVERLKPKNKIALSPVFFFGSPLRTTKTLFSTFIGRVYKPNPAT